MEHVIIHLR